MAALTISSKYQIVIPPEVRRRYGFKPGQKVIMLDAGGVLYLVPDIPIEDLYGFLKGVEIDLDDLREEEDID
jgi:AbrB family looped-hinge helix DNA binding protein